MDGETTIHLKCDVELLLECPTAGTCSKWAADALRKAADRLEKEQLQDGFHPLSDNVGKNIGTLYVDYSEGWTEV